jgi:hypothetical protein
MGSELNQRWAASGATPRMNARTLGSRLLSNGMMGWPIGYEVSTTPTSIESELVPL